MAKNEFLFSSRNKLLIDALNGYGGRLSCRVLLIPWARFTKEEGGAILLWLVLWVIYRCCALNQSFFEY